MRQDKKEGFYANLPNAGQVPGVPLGAIVESPAVVDAQGFHPIICPELSSGLKARLVKHLAWVELVVDAAVEQSREKLIQTFILDGVVNSTETLEKMADELVAAHAKYLPPDVNKLKNFSTIG